MRDEESHLNESLRKIVKGAGIGFIGTFIGLGLGYLSRMIIGRFLGAGDYGLICLGFAAMSIGITLSLVGLPSGVIRYVSFYKGKSDAGRIKGTIIGALRISIPLSLIFAITFFFGANWICCNVFHEPDLTPVLKIFSMAIPFYVSAQIFLSALIGFQYIQYPVYTEHLFQNIIKIVAIVLLLALGFGVLGAAWGWVLAIVLMPFLALYFLKKRVFSLLSTNVKMVSVDKELFLFSLPLVLAGIAGMITAWTDTLMLGYFSTASDVGVYNAALPTARLLMVVGGSFGTIFMPVLTELYGKEKLGDLGYIYSAVTKWVLSLTFPAFLLMFLFSKFVIKIMFGDEFTTGATALSILSFAFLITSVMRPTDRILEVIGRTKIIMLCGFFVAALNVILNFFLIPGYGINGAALATAISLVSGAVLSFMVVYHITRVQPFKLNHLKPIFSSILAVSVVYAIAKYIVGVTLTSMVIMLPVFLTLYFFVLLVMKGFEEEDLTIMRAIDERLGTRSDMVRAIIRRFL
ncbi:MAG TPA: flippase [Candidatus Syntrophoarchaeum butanivorans]|uniref:Flippase n=1 Tax=Candidatus Syntropharchaeum butanivorans TaxID=1839936 RepID=A0A1F2P4T4_9EURY|nr:MAG: polysaccharide biosynthesis protein [Candidatus Syntrophoarchaeum butanivorans]HEC56393.1 flippase [Candidatus Syntrophoarchaeum butanivorans]